MIELIYSPQRADFKSEYLVKDDVLTVKINNQLETYDFNDTPEGIAEEIISDLPIQCVLGAEKTGDIVTVKAIRFYGEDEKEVFESGENQMET